MTDSQPNRNAINRRLRLGWPEDLARSAPVGTRMRGGRMGEGCVRPDGYRVLLRGGRAVLEHILMAELALGRPLRNGEQVHHVNEQRADNRPDNLVICQDQNYHALLHLRADAIRAGCPAHWRRCVFCGTHDDPAELSPWGNGFVHRECRNRHKREYRARTKG